MARPRFSRSSMSRRAGTRRSTGNSGPSGRRHDTPLRVCESCSITNNVCSMRLFQMRCSAALVVTKYCRKSTIVLHTISDDGRPLKALSTMLATLNAMQMSTSGEGCIAQLDTGRLRTFHEVSQRREIVAADRPREANPWSNGRQHGGHSTQRNIFRTVVALLDHVCLAYARHKRW